MNNKKIFNQFDHILKLKEYQLDTK